MQSLLAAECVYCGSRENLTRDHVPGRGLFSPPLPSDLLTVPCCLRHNQEYAREDEYFRLVVSSRQESAGHPEAARASGKSFENLLRPESAGLERAFRESLLEPSATAKATESDGLQAVAMVDFLRLNRYAERIITALFAHHSGKRLSRSSEVRAFVLDCLDLTKPLNRKIYAGMARILERVPEHSSPRDILRYKFSDLSRAGGESVWNLVFFESTEFIGSIKVRPGEGKGDS